MNAPFCFQRVHAHIYSALLSLFLAVMSFPVDVHWERWKTGVKFLVCVMKYTHAWPIKLILIIIFWTCWTWTMLCVAPCLFLIDSNNFPASSHAIFQKSTRGQPFMRGLTWTFFLTGDGCFFSYSARAEGRQEQRGERLLLPLPQITTLCESVSVHMENEAIRPSWLQPDAVDPQ